MAGNACNDIGLWYPLEVNRLSLFCERSASIMGGLWRQRCKIIRQISRRVSTQIRGSPPHVLLRKRIVADVRGIATKLGLNVHGSLSSQSRRDRVTLRTCAMAPSAVTDTGRHRAARP